MTNPQCKQVKSCQGKCSSLRTLCAQMVDKNVIVHDKSICEFDQGIIFRDNILMLVLFCFSGKRLQETICLLVCITLMAFNFMQLVMHFKSENWYTILVCSCRYRYLYFWQLNKITLKNLYIYSLNWAHTLFQFEVFTRLGAIS